MRFILHDLNNVILQKDDGYVLYINSQQTFEYTGIYYKKKYPLVNPSPADDYANTEQIITKFIGKFLTYKGYRCFTDEEMIITGVYFQPEYVFLDNKFLKIVDIVTPCKYSDYPHLIGISNSYYNVLPFAHTIKYFYGFPNNQSFNYINLNYPVINSSYLHDYGHTGAFNYQNSYGHSGAFNYQNSYGHTGASNYQNYYGHSGSYVYGHTGFSNYRSSNYGYCGSSGYMNYGMGTTGYMNTGLGTTGYISTGMEITGYMSSGMRMGTTGYMNYRMDNMMDNETENKYCKYCLKCRSSQRADVDQSRGLM